jgi:hypothetical protein
MGGMVMPLASTVNTL